MKNKDLKRELNNEYKKLTPDVYDKVKKTPINRLLTIDSPEQENRRKVTLALVCIAFVILAVLVVSLFSYMIVPAKKIMTYNYVYVHINVEKDLPADTVSYGIVIDDDSNTLVCAINETTNTKINIQDKTIYNFASILNIENGNVLSISTLAANEDRNTNISIKLNDILNDYMSKNSLTITTINTSLSHNLVVSFIKSNNPEATLDITDSAETIINQYIYMTSKK